MALAGVLLTPFPSSAGIVEINQARALRGGVTPADAPGFPVTIDRAGSYRLTTDLTLPESAAAGNGIEIEAGEVTLDLNGFALVGREGSCGSAGTGIRFAPGSGALVVKNGTLRAWRCRALDVENFSLFPALRLERLKIETAAGGSGVTDLANALVQWVDFTGPGSGALAASHSIVRDTTAIDGGGFGFTGSANLLARVVARNNAFEGLAAISTPSGLAASSLTQNVGGGAQYVGPVVQLGPNQCDGDLVCP
jgi:hypothetical protein